MATYSNTQLIQILQKAARRINRRLSLTGTTNEVVINASTGEFTSPSDNDDLEDLVLLQAECMISAREFQEELSDGTVGVRAVDGEQELDTRSQAAARGTFFDSPNSPCEELREALKIYQMNNNTGKLIY